MKRGELIMFDHGRPHRTAACCESAEREGHGLRSHVYAQEQAFCRSRSSSSITSSTSSWSSSSDDSSNSEKRSLHNHGGPSLPIHDQQFQDQAPVSDNDDESSSSTIKSDMENAFNSPNAAITTSGKCCNAAAVVVPAPSAPIPVPAVIKSEKRKRLFGHREPCPNCSS
jgi:hypothetical protein